VSRIRAVTSLWSDKTLTERERFYRPRYRSRAALLRLAVHDGSPTNPNWAANVESIVKSSNGRDSRDGRTSVLRCLLDIPRLRDARSRSRS
jgi:hypothetical protein